MVGMREGGGPPGGGGKPVRIYWRRGRGRWKGEEHKRTELGISESTVQQTVFQ